MSNYGVAVLFGFLFSLFLLIGYYFGGVIGMTLGFVLALAVNLVSFWYSDKLVLKMYKAKPVREKDYPEIVNMIKKLAKKADIPKPKLYLVETDLPNAFATGRSPKKGVVAITKGLLKELEIDEVEGVLAHEISHIKNRDTLTSTAAATIAGAISWLAYIFYFSSDDRNALGFVLLFVLAPLAAMLIRMAISRNREFLADKTGAQLSNPLNLANALGKIAKASKNVKVQGNAATGHMFIINPFSSGSLIRLFSTHPPTEERVARLRKIAI